MLVLIAALARADDPPTVSLADAMDRAQQSAVSVRTAAAASDQARAGVDQAWPALLPTVQGQGALQYWDSATKFSLGGDSGGEAPVPVGPEVVVREQLTWSGTLRIVQPLTGLPTSAEQHRAARAGVAAADASLDQARDSARFVAADAWYAALEFDAQAEVAAAQVRTLEERRRSVAIAVEARAGVRNDLLQVELALSQARQAALVVGAMRDAAYRQLSMATGGDGRPLRADGVLPDLSAAELAEEDALVDRALGARADLRALAAQIDAARSEVRATQLQRVPQVSAIGSVTHQEGQSLGTPANSGFVGLNADWTIWAWNRQGAVTTASKAGLAQLEAQRDGLVAAVRSEVAARRIAVATARSSWAVAGDRVAQADENLALFRNRYDAGAATTLELLDAESQAVAARSAELGARYGALRAEAALALAVGD